MCDLTLQTLSQQKRALRGRLFAAYGLKLKRPGALTRTLTLPTFSHLLFHISVGGGKAEVVEVAENITGSVAFYLLLRAFFNFNQCVPSP